LLFLPGLGVKWDSSWLGAIYPMAYLATITTNVIATAASKARANSRP
jgi:hypothetical protein